MKRLIVIAVCALLTSPAWADGPTLNVQVDIDLLGNAVADCPVWNGSSCVYQEGGTLMTRGGAYTNLRIPQYWDGSGVGLRYVIKGEYGSPTGGDPEPSTLYRLGLEIFSNAGGSTSIYQRVISVPYTIANEVVEVDFTLEDLGGVVNPGELYVLQLHTNFYNWPDGDPSLGGVVFNFSVALPFTGGDCNWDGVVDASDMACLVNAVFE